MAAQIVSVPMAVPEAMAAQAFQALLVDMGAVFLTSLVVLDLALLFAVVRPLRKLSEMADEISVGKMNMPELPVKGKDEIAEAISVARAAISDGSSGAVLAAFLTMILASGPT